MAATAPCLISEKTRSEVVKMSIEVMEKPVSDRQMEYIKRLQTEIGEQDLVINKGVNSSQASMIIGKLIAKAEKKNGTNNHVKINEPRLGMAMKECFRVWSSLGRDVLHERRNSFIEEVIKTYNLFTEIAERLSQKSHNSR